MKINIEDNRLKHILNYLEYLVIKYAQDVAYLNVKIYSEYSLYEDDIEIRPNVLSGLTEDEIKISDEIEKILIKKKIVYFRNIVDGKKSRLIVVHKSNMFKYEWEKEHMFKSYIGINKYNL